MECLVGGTKVRISIEVRVVWGMVNKVLMICIHVS